VISIFVTINIKCIPGYLALSIFCWGRRISATAPISKFSYIFAMYVQYPSSKHYILTCLVPVRCLDRKCELNLCLSEDRHACHNSPSTSLKPVYCHFLHQGQPAWSLCPDYHRWGAQVQGNKKSVTVFRSLDEESRVISLSMGGLQLLTRC
jgi:hypothetical protein